MADSGEAKAPATDQEQKKEDHAVNNSLDAAKPKENSVPVTNSVPPTDSASSTNPGSAADSGSGTPASPTPSTPGAGPSFKAQFKAFSKFGDTKSDGKHITLSQSDKWMKQAKVIDGKKITTTDTGIHYKKFKQQKLGYDDYNKFLDELAKNKKVEVQEIKDKMASCGAPGHTSSSPAGKVTAAVDRLTDPTRYTGAHKQRFDETGKGRGIAGRRDLPDQSGYVHGYQNKNTYDKNH